MPRHLISDAHEWINEVCSIPCGAERDEIIIALCTSFHLLPPLLPSADSHCPYLLSSETTAKGTGLEKSAGKEDPVELDSSLML